VYSIDPEEQPMIKSVRVIYGASKRIFYFFQR
jgi:hypothetical protein